MNRKANHHPTTHFLMWFGAVLCSLIAAVVILAGIIIFFGYLIVRPRVPFISIVDAHLEQFQYDPTAGSLMTEMRVVVRSENDNTKARATFSDMKLVISFDGYPVARLVSGTYEVPKNSSLDFDYMVTLKAVPLVPDQMHQVEKFLKENLIIFELKGMARTRWKVGVIGSVRYWCHLICELRFRLSSGIYLPDDPKRCTSKYKRKR